MASVTWNPGINSSNPTITMTVTQTSQSIANNTSTVSWSLVLKRPSSISSSVNKPYSVVIDGVTVASGSTSIDGSGDKTIASGTRTIQHGSDGKKTLSFSFTVDVMPLYWSGVPTGNASGSGSMTLTTIPRASTLNSFSFPNALKISTATSFSLGITRASSSFTHDIELRDGTTVLQSWNGQGVPTSLTISSSVVNTILSRMSTVTSKTLTLRVQTKSGSTNIGSAVTRTATVSVHSSVTPTASGLTVSIYGSGRDKQINKFVQNISRVTSSFTGTATGGASVSSRKIVIRRASDGSNSQTISSGSGTTIGRVTLSGTYEAIATVTDSRGRSATQRITFTVHAYSPPKVTSFTAVRNSSTPTTVNIGRYGSWSSLNGDNYGIVSVKRGSVEIQNVSDATGIMSGTLNDTGVSVTSSYTYTVTLTDSFGNSVSASATVSTQKVVLDIHKNEGVGIGKIHEKGSLDVGGTAYFERMGYHGVPSGANLNDYTTPGFYYNSSNATVATMSNTPNARAFGLIVIQAAGVVQMWFEYNTRNVYLRAMYNNNWGSWGLIGGTTSIAWGNVTDKPSTFPPSSHSHSWSSITSKPSTFPPSSHTHSYLPLSGGTTTGTTALGNGKLRVYTTGAYEIRIDNNAGSSNDVTIRPSTTDKGNVGTTAYRFDVIRGRVMSSSSDRSSKENINIFDEETAYEQIKDIPIYTFSFEHDSYVDHNIGTMIEYMPVEMLETGKEIYVKPGEEKMYSLNNAIFYLMAGFKVAQRKIEDLEEENRELKSRLERLEEIVLEEEI